MVFTAIVIDNDRYSLYDFIEVVKPIEGLKIVKKFLSISASFSFLNDHGRVNFIFSGIQMPGISGIEAGKFLAEYCDMLVYTTGFSGFSLEAFGVGAKGYLLKPVSMLEVFKLVKDLSLIKNQKLASSPKPPEFIVGKLFNDVRSYNIALKGIILLSAWGNYVKIHTLENVYLKYGSLTKMETMFCQGNDFNRIHQSYIISRWSIKSVKGNEVMLVNGEHYFISRSRKKAFSKFYDGKNE